MQYGKEEDIMRLRNILIVVEDIEKSKKFYHDLFGLETILDDDACVILSEGLVLQKRSVWEKTIQKNILQKNHASELYFEEYDMDRFIKILEQNPYPIDYVTSPVTYDWGKTIVRFYDPDGNLIEVGNPI